MCFAAAGRFFFNDTATTEIYTLSLHDALPIFVVVEARGVLNVVLGLRDLDGLVCLVHPGDVHGDQGRLAPEKADRKSTRLNSSHANISYAVFCLKKKTGL